MKTALFFFISILWLGCSQPTDNSIANTQNKEQPDTGGLGYSQSTDNPIANTKNSKQQDTIKWAFPPYQEWDDALYMGIPEFTGYDMTYKMVKGVIVDKNGIPDKSQNAPNRSDEDIFCFVTDTLICRYKHLGNILIDTKKYGVVLLEHEYKIIGGVGKITGIGSGLEYIRYENNKIWAGNPYYQGEDTPEFILFDFSEKIGTKRGIKGFFFTRGDSIELQSINYSPVYHDTIFRYYVTTNIQFTTHADQIKWMDVGKKSGITGFGFRMGSVTEYKFTKFNNYSKKENLNAVFQLTDKEPKWKDPYSE